MSTLRVADLLKVFDNYEPSRTRVWEIVRTIHPVHCAALLYLLENVSKSRDTVPLKLLLLQQQDEDASADTSATAGWRRSTPAAPVVDGVDRVYRTAVKPTLNLTRVTVTRQLRSETNDTDPYIYDLRDAHGDLTVIGLMHIVRDENACKQLTLAERVVMHNLRTAYYTRFVHNVKHYLLPDDMHDSRNEFDTQSDTRNVTQKFLRYYHSMTALTDGGSGGGGGGNGLRYCGNTNPKSFRYVTRPPCRQMDSRPPDLVPDYVVQPLYQGYRVVVNSNERETRCYNCYGDLLHGFLYDQRFTVNATFEAIVLPVDGDGRLRSWRYGVRDRRKVAILVVDVFRVEHDMLVQLPFGERVSHAVRIGGANVRPLPTDCEWDALERSYHARADLFDPVVGVVVRHRLASCSDPAHAYRFNMTACYDFLTDTVTRLAGSVSLKEFQRVHFNLDMADRRTVCTVYAHDDLYYYVCVFDRQRYQFVHHAVLERLSDIARLEPKYRREHVYVIGAKRLPMGVMFLRVYYSRHDLSVVGFEQKITTSMYDVPHSDPFLLDTS